MLCRCLSSGLLLLLLLKGRQRGNRSRQFAAAARARLELQPFNVSAFFVLPKLLFFSEDVIETTASASQVKPLNISGLNIRM